MKVAIEAGAEIDIVTPEELRRELKRAADVKPIRREVRNSAVIPNPTALTIVDLGMPPQGYLWEVRLLMVSAADPLTAGVGTAAGFIGMPPSPPLGSNVFDPLEAIAFFAAVPGATTFSKEQAVIQGTDHLYAAFKGATAGATVVAKAVIFGTLLQGREVTVN